MPEVTNHGSVPMRLWAGMKICQLIFEQTLHSVPHMKLYRWLFSAKCHTCQLILTLPIQRYATPA
jgi:hypothetical protein